MNNKDLIRQYVSSGLELDSYQINKLSNNFKRTYFKVRMRNPEFYLDREISLIPEDMQIDALKNQIIKGLKSGYIKPDSKFFQNIEEYLWEPSRYKKLYNEMGRDEFIKFCIVNGYKYWAKHLEDVDFKLRQLFTKEQFKEYSELYIKAAMARGYGISTEMDILNAGYGAIKEFVDDVREKGGLKGSKLDIEDEIFNMQRARMMLPTLMKFKEFNEILTPRDMASLLLYLPEVDTNDTLKRYLSNGGSLEKLNAGSDEVTNNFLKYFLNKLSSTNN
jgi:hypothetical protein